ncbi:MAG: BMP family lipoprotein [Streptosporangiaceae bacterium]
MRAKLPALAGLGAAALLAAGCSSAVTSAHSSPASRPSARASSAAARSPGSAAPAARFLACLAPDTGGIHDRSVNELAWRGMQQARAAEPGRISVSYRPSASAADYPASIGALVRRGCGIVVTVGLLMGDSTQQAAKASPRQKFAIVDYFYRPPVRNIDALAFDTAQAAFLGGYLAAGMSKTGVVGTFGGQQLAPVTGYLDGFADGVRYYDRHQHATVQVLGWSEQAQQGLFINTFITQSAAQSAARALIGQHADVIFPVAGSAGLGAARAVQQADAAAGRDKVALEWSDTDGCFTAPRYCRYLLASVTKGIAPTVRNAVLAAAAGRFRGGTSVGTLASGGVALSGLAARVPARLRSELAQVREEITSGKIVPATPSRR